MDRQRLWSGEGGATIWRMELEVHSGTRASVAARTWLTTVLFMALASSGAALLSHGRGGVGLLSRVYPAGWGASFCPPSGFESVGPEDGESVTAFEYAKRLETGGLAEIAVQRVARPAPPPEEVIGRYMLPHLPLLQSFFGNLPAKFDAQLGPLDGVEVRNPGIPMIIRAAESPVHEVFAVWLRTHGAPIDDTLYRSFDAVCRSFEITGPGGGQR